MANLKTKVQYNIDFDWSGNSGQENLRKIEDTSVSNTTKDEYHTMEELYEHRTLLFANLCNLNQEHAWKSLKYSDGTPVEDGWFIAGIDSDAGQISYHQKIEYWDLFNVRDFWYPIYDGHTSKDVLERLELMIKSTCIFIDIDGVLNSNYGNRENKILSEPYKNLDLRNLLILKDLVKYSPVSQIVIASHWNEYSELEKAFKELDIRFDHILKLNNRHKEKVIEEYVKKNGIKDFVLVDDDNYFSKNDEYRDNLIRTNPHDGLTYTDCCKVWEKLGYRIPVFIM